AYRSPGLSRFQPGVRVEVMYRTFSSYMHRIAPSSCRCIAACARARRYSRTRCQLMRSCQSIDTEPNVATAAPLLNRLPKTSGDVVPRVPQVHEFRDAVPGDLGRRP